MSSHPTLHLVSPGTTTLYHLVVHAAGNLPLFGLVSGERMRTSSLGELIRQRWRNLPLEYPEFGFERFTLFPERFEALIRVPGSRFGRSPLRGMVAHFKASVTRDAPDDQPVWRSGYEAWVEEE